MPKRKANALESPTVELHPTQSIQAQISVGKIKSVVCKRFVTYRECAFHPTEYLNVIIGPNGTGKSTLVAAIVLGLGGEPKLLSRDSAIQSYIKNGNTDAEISVEIFKDNDGKTTTFHRKFYETGKSDFKVNEDTVSKSNFLKAVAGYNIQINNLCQFLPQDRVQDFAKMNPQEILNNTLKSVCNQKTVDDFAKLKDLRKNQIHGQEILKKNKQKLAESITRKEELKQTLERFNARNEYIEKLNICKAKKLWLEFDAIKEKAKEVQNDLNEANKSYNLRKKTYDGIIKSQEAVAKKSNDLNDAYKKKEQKMRVIFEDKNKIVQMIEDSKKKIRESKTNFEKKKRELIDRQNEIRNEAKVLEAIKEDLKIAATTLGRESDRVSKLQHVESELENLKDEIKRNLRMRSDINKKLDEEYSSEVQMLKSRLERSKNVEAQKLQLLQNNHPDVHKAILWLDQNRQIFQGTVYKPVILELNVSDPKNAQYFENTIPFRDLLSFVCECKADMSTLVEELCIKQKLTINVAHSPPASECGYKPNAPISTLQKFGFTSYLIDLVEGPPSILNHLCSLYRLHTIPIGTDAVNKYTDSIPSNIRQYFGGDHRYNVSISKYSKELSLMQARIKGKNLLISCDINEIQRIQHSLNGLLQKSDALKNKRTCVEAKINDLEHQRGEILNQKRTIESSVARFNQLKDQINRQQIKISNLRTNISNVPEMEEEFKKSTLDRITQIIQLQEDKVKILQSYQSAVANKNIAKTIVHIHKEQNEELINAIKDATDNLHQSKKVVDTITNALESVRKKLSSKLEQARNSTNNCKPTDANFPYTEMFRELPDDQELLGETINDIAARLDCMGEVDQDVVTEYERRCAEIEALQSDIVSSTSGEEKITSEINAIYVNWFREISSIVERINQHFGEFMESMSYVGEVLLAKKDDVYDFDAYGIQIMVQYRKNVPLQALDRHVQSGGERAVAIAVYTLSLQHITHVPFRCVDEINQGMDARNERKIFEMLVDETTQPGRSQYFFVTPKLLPNLKYNERMAVHLVFNGKSMQSRNAFAFIL